MAYGGGAVVGVFFMSALADTHSTGISVAGATPPYLGVSLFAVGKQLRL